MKRAFVSVILCAVAALAQNAPTSQSLAGLWDPRSVVENLNTVVKGKPFSATAVLKSTQTLEDGSHINRTTTTMMYRDADGRTRNETDGVIRISDPAGVRIELDPQNKLAYKTQAGGSVALAPVVIRGGAAAAAGAGGLIEIRERLAEVAPAR